VKAWVIPDAFSWIVLIFLIPFWFFMYMYLDSIIPNTFGISKHPLFCCKKKQTIEKIRASMMKKAHDPKVFSREDPIQIEGLTKNFGSFTAVKDLSFSIR
jgi:hypothetical protein